MQEYSSRAIAQRLVASLQGLPVFTEVKGSGFLAGIEYDGLVVGANETGEHPTRRVFLEVSLPLVVDLAISNEVKRKLSILQGAGAPGQIQYLFLTSGAMTNGARKALEGSDVIVRTLRSLNSLCSDFWATLSHNFQDPGLSDRAQELIDALMAVPEGRSHWAEYESICRSILSFLFSPHLGNPTPQSSTLNKSQRRDIVLRNQARDGFWAWVRERYGADYVIVEMKNNKGAVSNTSVWQLAGYMKQKGVGFFGMLIARNGVARGAANYAIIDQWVHSNKMIVPVSNDDLVQMIRLRDNGSDPADFIGSLIDRVRCWV